MFEDFVNFVRSIYNTNELIPLHEPRFTGNEKQYLLDTIDSSFVSTAGEYVTEFENKVAEYTGAKYAIATVNGTAALHAALQVVDVKLGDEVITQSLSFIATSNAIRYCGANPIFVDVEKSNLGLCPNSLEYFLRKNTKVNDDGECRNVESGARIQACVPMHTFGHPVNIKEIRKLCDEYHIQLIEDAAQALGSYNNAAHVGHGGAIGVLSFNGNKIVTCGGGGMILTNDQELAFKVKHLTTTSRKPHAWHIEHNEIGYNYRMPNINAALGCAQIERLSSFIDNKRELAKRYKNWLRNYDISFVSEPPGTQSNYWLNAFVLKDCKERDNFLEYSNSNGVMTRPVWTPTHRLPMYKYCQSSNLENTNWLFERLVNIPSSVTIRDE